ncbi:MAG: peptidylprolyl isomerase [Bacteroidales bacterium]|nr:peptidylprolyl isomerase [Bacteroidales bacterium]MDD4361413.1 peptidylprolyl isomerase [Bacteroidales bacterium]MDD4429974.1 peptidylprolyl isomerase [Bacteroidales bacterium]
MKHLLWLLLLMPAWLQTCLGKETESPRVAVVQVSDAILYLDEIQNTLPAGLNSSDSIRLANSFIENWVKEAILYQSASKNLGQSPEINRMVENYRRSLIIYQYQQQALIEKMETEVTEADMAEYYEKNANRFLSNKNLIKGLFIKVPLSAPGLDKLKTWYKKNDTESLDNIEKYSFQNASIYEYFHETWTSLDDVMDQIPTNIANQEKFLRNQKFLEIEDDNYCYLLYISDYITAGSPQPLDYVSAQIKNILINSRKTEFIHQFENEMFEQAKRKGEIKYFSIPVVDTASTQDLTIDTQ